MRYGPLFGALLLASVSGCAPRIITSITGSGEQVKLVYERNSFFKGEVGLLQCARQPDGTLNGCRKMPIVFLDEKKK